MKRIVMVGTLDTKEDLILFARNEIEKLGHSVIVIDTSTRDHSSSAADISCKEIAEAAGNTIEEILTMKDRGEITSLMTKGAINKSKALLAEGKMDGILSLGGAGAATVGTAVMRALPFGIPKLMVSAAAGMPAYAGRWFGTGDIMMMNTIVDLAGLNKLVKNVLTRAAGAICGMVSQSPASLSELLTGSGKAMIAMTEDGSSEKCASYVRKDLVEKGYEVVIFHAQGMGDKAMEELINHGYFDAVVDIALVGVSDELFEGNRPGGRDRLEMAGKRGIPQVLTPCGLNMTGCGPTRKNSEKYASRSRILRIDDLRMGTRLNDEELTLTAMTVAKKLNQANGPVKFFIPMKGWSGFDPPGGVLYSPEEDMIFVDELKRQINNDHIEIIEVDSHLEDPRFAKKLVEGFEDLMKTKN
ncbi:MAG: Tm-1-like ATP-binding domain-containing protein [Deltaproteobacteria bacterium]|nr:Tm-1-like ATP-binding domain-containing protein [Deltaproteobacteria bacterium]